jgi:uncharacterized oxidoreductase
MKTSNHTILITGGSAGIGFAIAKLFSEHNNHVIITGRNKEKLERAAAKLNHVTPIVCDVTSKQDVDCLVTRLQCKFPTLNMVINNAGIAFVYKLNSDTNAFEKAEQEMLTNYLSIVRLNEKLLPLLAKQHEAAIVNISSSVAFVPNHTMPTYGASKVALHSYSLSLRTTLDRTSGIKVFELIPPLVNTEFSKEIGGHNGIAPDVVAQALFNGLHTNTYEIQVGRSSDIKYFTLRQPMLWWQ